MLKISEVSKNAGKGLQFPFAIALCALASAIIVTGCGGGSNDEGIDRTNELLIKNVSIVSAERAATSEPQDVLIRDDRIVEIGLDLSDQGLEEDSIIDGTNQFLSPGLIDSHTHLSNFWSMTAEQQQANPEIVSAAREQFPRSYLYYGFTTLIDLATSAEIISEWNDRAVRPQVYFCGAAPLVDGYPMANYPEPLRYEQIPNFVYDESQDLPFPEGYDKAEHTPEFIVDKIKSDGAICLKMFYEPGFGDQRNNLPLPSLELLQALTAAGHENDLPVVLHATSLAGQQFGLQAGVDAFVHGLFSPGLNAEAIQMLDEINQLGIGWQPTIQVLYGVRDLHDPNYLAGSELQNALPRSLIEWYGTEDGQWFRNDMAVDFDWFLRTEEPNGGGWQEILATDIENAIAATNYLATLDGPLLFGSDTPANSTFANPPGLNGRMEMNNWQAAGVTALQAFQAATIKNAEFFGLQNEIGTVEIGKQADLLLLLADPTETIEAYDSIQMIILDGEVLNRADLAAVNNE